MKTTYHRIVTQESNEEWDSLRITVHNAKWIELVHQKTKTVINLDPQTIRLLNQILRELD